MSSDSSPKASSATLRSPAFLSLLAMQALTVVNDNAFRWLVVGIGKQHVIPQRESMVLSIAMVSFVLPFLILAAPAGYLADRFPKRRVILVSKFAEFVLVVLAVGATYFGHLLALFVVLAMIGAQAALFSPAKLGCIPEMLESSRLSAANGAMGLVTV